MLVTRCRASAVVGIVMLAAGCGGVSAEKYNAVLTEADRYKQDAAAQSQRVADCEQKLASLPTRTQASDVSAPAAQPKSEDFKALSAALATESAAGVLEIAELSGQLTIRLPEKLLFTPGSAVIVKKGKVTLRKVATAMKGVPGRVFSVAGNTDDKPVKTRQFPSNWELSIARAVAVVHFFQAAGVDPKTLGAAGYGQYHPIAANDTAEGRAKNRRIDIGVAPPPGELPAVR